MSSKRCAAGLVWLLAAALVSHAHAEDAAPNQPQTYCVIPIKGVIGSDFTTGQLRACLKEAERLKPAVVVLELDTGGGDINDAEGIVDLIIEHKDLEFVALVRKALSAGAAITLACKDIYVTEKATIGGAVSYSVAEDGHIVDFPKDVAEKFQSIWRAVCRKAAEHGGHPSLFAEAMTDPDFALTMRKEDGRLVLERDGKGELLKARGRILTLTSREAVSCELAKGTAADCEALVRLLGMQDWHRIALPEGPQPVAGQFTPRALYRVLSRMGAALRLGDPMTEAEEMEAIRIWNNWCQQQRFKGSRVVWNLAFDNVCEHNVGLYFGLPCVESSRWPTNAMVGKEHPMSLVPEPHRVVSKCPVAVQAVSVDEPMFHVEAWASNEVKTRVAKIPKGSMIAVSGVVENLAPYVLKDGRFSVHVVLDNCSVVCSNLESKSPMVTKADTECKGWLSMARNYIRAGMPEKAIPYLKKVIERYGDTEYAKQARELEQEALQMMRAQSEGKDAPPTEVEPTPELTK